MSAPAINTLKAKLYANEPAYVFGVRTACDAAIVTLAMMTGHDAIYLDFQHSTLDLRQAGQIYQAGLHAGFPVISRVPNAEPTLVGRIMDAGGQGLMVADIRSRAEAEAVVRAALMAPDGDRSAGMPLDPRFPGHSGQSLMASINAQTLLIAMVETEEGIAAASEIISTLGIDALQIGSVDLTAAMGIAGEFRHPRLVDAYRQAALACRAAKKPLVIGGIRKPEDIAPYMAMGAARCYFTGSDTGFLVEGGRLARASAETADKEANPA